MGNAQTTVQQPTERVLHHYGVRRSKKTGKLQSFWGKGKYANQDALLTREVWGESGDVVRQKAQALLEEWERSGGLAEPSLPIEPGTFCVHADADGHHNCLVIGHTDDPGMPVFHALLLTTNAYWNNWCREATEVEIAQLVPSSRLQSWLAPVTRPVSEFFRATHRTDPETLASYQREFKDAIQPAQLGAPSPDLKTALNAWARWYSERLAHLQRYGNTHNSFSRQEQALFDALGRNPKPFER